MTSKPDGPAGVESAAQIVAASPRIRRWSHGPHGRRRRRSRRSVGSTVRPPRPTWRASPTTRPVASRTMVGHDDLTRLGEPAARGHDVSGPRRVAVVGHERDAPEARNAPRPPRRSRRTSRRPASAASAARVSSAADTGTSAVLVDGGRVAEQLRCLTAGSDAFMPTAKTSAATPTTIGATSSSRCGVAEAVSVRQAEPRRRRQWETSRPSCRGETPLRSTQEPSRDRRRRGEPGTALRLATRRLSTTTPIVAAATTSTTMIVRPETPRSRRAGRTTALPVSTMSAGLR